MLGQWLADPETDTSYGGGGLPHRYDRSTENRAWNALEAYYGA